ncbi:MAG: carbonate dehydratase [Pseudomonadota bacterium]
MKKLLDNNARWAAEAVTQDPEFFLRLMRQQRPDYLWIGCSDSRVPANEIVDLLPGELFVHRNVANVVSHSDLNCQSVIQFAVDVLKIKHIIVVGHYRCSGVHAALHDSPVGLSQHWLGHVRDVASRHKALLDREPTPEHRESLLCELNVLEQAANVCSSTAVTAAWSRGQPLSVHGWIYGLRDGRLRSLDFSVSENLDLSALRERAVKQILDARAQHAKQRIKT